MRSVLLTSMLCVVAVACAEYPAKLAEGRECQRSVECSDGLACVENVCSADLTGIAGMVPAEGGVDAALADASMMDTSMPDTSMPDTSMPDTSMPDTSMPDTSMPDASMPDDAAVDPDATP